MRIGGRGRRALLVALSLLALPGLLLLFRDLLLPDAEDVADRARRLGPLARAEAERRGVPVALVLGVIAVESKGEARARSSKGALGVMQLMPATAREEAALLGDPEPSEEDLLDPATNIRLGTSYLARQLERYGGSEILALAAYHAGPGRVNDWIRGWPGREPAEIVERAAFPSTRSYVRSVLEYRQRFENDETTLTRRE